MHKALVDYVKDFDEQASSSSAKMFIRGEVVEANRVTQGASADERSYKPSLTKLGDASAGVY